MNPSSFVTFDTPQSTTPTKAPDDTLTGAGPAPRNYVLFSDPSIAPPAVPAKSPMVGPVTGGLALRRHVLFDGVSATPAAPAKPPMVNPVIEAGPAPRNYVLFSELKAVVPVKSATVAEIAAAVSTQTAVVTTATKKSAAVAEVAAARSTQSATRRKRRR